MSANKFISEQRKLMNKMREASLRVIFGCAMPDPSLRMLKSRYRAASRLSDLAAQLRNSIWSQLKENK